MKPSLSPVSQKTVNTAICAALILVLLFIVGSTLEIRRLITWEQEAEERRMDCLLLSQELAGVSDELTSAMQKFVMTGDYSHMEAYWTEVNTGKNRETVMAQLEAYDLPEQEIKLMHRALSNSRLLTTTETRVMRLALDAYDPGDYTVPEEVTGYVLNVVEREMDTQARLEYARELAFGEDYAAEKAVITGSIQSFQQTMNARLADELEVAGQATRRAITRQVALLALTGVLLVAVWVVFHRLTLRPIERYTGALRHMGRSGEEPLLRPEGSRELRLFADKFNHMYRDMVAAGEARDQFFSNMSHELRTPLHAMVECQYLLGQTDLDGDQRRYLSALESASQSLLLTVNDILDLSKLERGKVQIEQSSFAAADFFRGIGEIFSPMAADKGISFITELDGAMPPYLLADRGLLNQIVTNLVSNAIKFTHRGEVTLEAGWAGDLLTLRVTDTGEGIRAEDRERIFERFEQIAPARDQKYTGTGLGLAICKSLVDLLGGTIALESEYGAGSRFTVRLPVKSGEPLPGPSPPALTPLPAGRTALLVEDDDLSRRMGAELLGKMGLEVTPAADGPEALSLARAFSYDLILLDLRMLPWDGFETAAKIRGEGRSRTAKIIALSADTDPRARKASLVSGIDGYLSKPLDMDELYTLLAALPGWTPPRVKTPSPPPGSGGGGVHLDHAAALGRMGGDEALYADLLRRFLSGRKAELEDLPDAVRRGDQKQLTLRLHTLAGLAAGIGAGPLAAALRRLEAAVKGGVAPDEWEAGARDAVNLYRATETEILAYLESCPSPPPAGAGDGEVEAFLRCLKQSDARAAALFRRVEGHYRETLEPEQFAALIRAVEGYRFDLAWTIAAKGER